MGLYPNGTLLSWEEIKENVWKVHKIGVLQFITIYNKYKDISGYSLKWGDEVSIYTHTHCKYWKRFDISSCFNTDILTPTS